MTDSTTVLPGTPLIDVNELHEQIAAGGLCVIDCRFSLADTAAGERLYRDAHLPGAHYAHLDHDLSSPIVSGLSSRHPLPDPERLVQTFRRFGMANDSRIVFYDDAGGAMAARAWWLCLWLGHERCQVLDGGFKAWTRQNYPLSGEKPLPGQGTFTRRAARVHAVEHHDVLQQDRQLVDARDPDRFTGRHEPLDPVAGHIPGAVNHPFMSNLDDNGCFLPVATLQQQFASLLDQAGGKILTHYCGSGVTAAHNMLAMTAAGLPPGELYAGSWSEWVQDPDRPVATVA